MSTCTYNGKHNYVLGIDHNQPLLLNKSQINMGFTHFHECGILSGTCIWAPYQIDVVKMSGFCNGSIILIWYWFSLITHHDFGRWKQHLFYILCFTRLCRGIDNCFYAVGNTRNTTKFEPFYIEHQPIQIREQRGIEI